jgi:protein TonB
VNLGDLCAGYYPSASRRLSEEGSVVILIYISPNGKVTETKIETSSGVPRLDEATDKCVRLGRFDPMKVGTEAQGSWQRLKYTWRLTS